MNGMLKFGLLGAGVYVGVVGAMYLIQRSMMYHPVGDLPAPAAVGLGDMEAVALRTQDGLDLVAWYRPPVEPGMAELVYFHGNAGNISWRAERARRFLDAGFGLLLVSYRGYGDNPGKPTEEGLYADGRAALAFLAGREVPGSRVGLVGESLGTGVAVAMASEHEVGAVVLESPYTSTADVGQRAYPIIPVKWLMKDRFDSLSRIEGIGAPLLVIHGEADRVIPVDFGRRLFAAAPEPKKGIFLPGAGHGNLDDFGAAESVIQFLREVLAPPKGVRSTGS